MTKILSAIVLIAFAFSAACGGMDPPSTPTCPSNIVSNAAQCPISGTNPVVYDPNYLLCFDAAQQPVGPCLDRTVQVNPTTGAEVILYVHCVLACP